MLPATLSTRFMNPGRLSQMASYDAAINVSARRYLPYRTTSFNALLEPSFFELKSSCYAASNFCQALDLGAQVIQRSARGRGLRSSTFQLNLSRLCHKIYPTHPLIPLTNP